MPTRNSEILASFVEFCVNRPDLRFWQALHIWSEIGFILATKGKKEWRDSEPWDSNTIESTFYWEGRNRHEK